MIQLTSRVRQDNEATVLFCHIENRYENRLMSNLTEEDYDPVSDDIKSYFFQYLNQNAGKTSKLILIEFSMNSPLIN